MAKTNLDDVLAELAIRHNVLVGKDDPILMMVTIFDKAIEQVIGDHVVTLNAQHEANLKVLIKAVQQGTEETKVRAGRVVTEGTAYACDQLRAAIKEEMDKGREELRKDIRLAWNKIDQARKVAVFSAAVSVCALVAVLAMFNVA